jgi:lipoyl(octanoyl) transferase
MHGFALNLDVDLEPFTTFRPCGLDGSALTSLRALGLPVPPLEQAASELSDHVMWSLLASSVDTAGAPR